MSALDTGAVRDAIRVPKCKRCDGNGELPDPTNAMRWGDACPDCGGIGRVDADVRLAARLLDEVDRLRGLLARALPWIDPNDSHEDYLLTVEIRKALGEGA